MRAVWISGVTLLMALGLLAAQEVDLAKAYDAGVAALEAGAYDEGLKIVRKVLEETGETGLSLYGPSFGHFHYLQGMLLIGKKEYRDALEPLRAAAEDYGNEKRQSGQAPNLFLHHARMQWGMCLQALGNYQEAAGQFEAVLAADKGAEPKINRFALELNLARCYLRIRKQGEGKEILARLLGNADLPAETVRDAFTVLAEEGDGQTDVMGLVRQHSRALLGNAKMNPRFAALAARSLNGGDPVQALVWYNLITPPGREIRAWEGEIARLEQQQPQAEERGRRDLVEKLRQAAGERRKALEEAQQRHAANLLGMGAAHYQIGSLSAAYVIFRELLARFPQLEQRPQILHNAVLCATLLERGDDAVALGSQFSAEFPQHPLKAGISQVLAEVVFTRGDYATSLRMAQESRNAAPAGSAGRDSLDFVVAASLVQLERWNEAERELLAFLAAYPQNPHAGDARYFLGVMKSKQAKWDEARRWLTEYVEQYRDGASRAHALYLLGLACLVQDEPLQALLLVNRLLGDYRTAPETALAHNVKGDAQLALGESYETVRVQGSYLSAWTVAQQFGPEYEEAGAYALKQLVALAVQAKRWEEAAGYFGEFIRLYPESRWRTDATVSATQALAATGKRNEALRLLEDLVAFEAGRRAGASLEQAVRSYSDFMAETIPPQDRLAKLKGFAKARDNAALQGMLLVSQIEALEEQGEGTGEARTGELFGELEKLHEAKAGDLTGLALVRLARWHSEGKGDHAGALRVYDEVLRRREEGEAYGLALAESAALLYGLDPASNAALAEERFREALGVTGAAEVREQAVLGLARLATDGKRWKEAETRWLEYLDQRDWRLARPEANYGYATSLDGAGRAEEALKVYVSVYANFPGELNLATAAYLRASELLWNSGRQVDALKVLQDMLRRLEGAKHPNIAKAETRFFQWRDQFAAGQKR